MSLPAQWNLFARKLLLERNAEYVLKQKRELLLGALVFIHCMLLCNTLLYFITTTGKRTC